MIFFHHVWSFCKTQLTRNLKLNLMMSSRSATFAIRKGYVIYIVLFLRYDKENHESCVIIVFHSLMSTYPQYRKGRNCFNVHVAASLFTLHAWFHLLWKKYLGIGLVTRARRKQRSISELKKPTMKNWSKGKLVENYFYHFL